jgi:hypothetical protein
MALMTPVRRFAVVLVAFATGTLGMVACGGSSTDDTVAGGDQSGITVADNDEQETSTSTLVTSPGSAATDTPVPEQDTEVLLALETAYATLSSVLAGRVSSTEAGPVDPNSPFLAQATTGTETERVRAILVELKDAGERYDGTLSSRAALLRARSASRALIWSCTEVDLLKVSVASGEFLTDDMPSVSARELVLLLGSDGVWRIESTAIDSVNFRCGGAYNNEVAEQPGATIAPLA